MRRTRTLATDATYHVTMRTNGKKHTLLDPKTKELYLQTLNRAKKKYNFTIYNFCIMNNHVHFLLHPHSDSNLSRIMQWISSVFAMAYNRQAGECGHFWGERFFSKIVKSIADFVALFRYINDNPLKAGLVADSIDWPFGALGHHRKGLFNISDAPEPWLLVQFPEHKIVFAD